MTVRTAQANQPTNQPANKQANQKSINALVWGSPRLAPINPRRHKLATKYADEEWPGNSAPMFGWYNKNNQEKLDRLVQKIEPESSVLDLGFLGPPIHDHIRTHFAEKRRMLKKGYDYEKINFDKTVSFLCCLNDHLVCFLFSRRVGPWCSRQTTIQKSVRV